MCGRFTQQLPEEEICDLYSVRELRSSRIDALAITVRPVSTSLPAALMTTAPARSPCSALPN